MKVESLARPAVLTQPIYEPGKPIEDVARELGLDPAKIIKLASNENPNGPSPRAVHAAERALEQGQLYPDGGCYALRQRLAAEYGLGADQFVVGNGSNEIIELLGHAFLGPGDEAVMGDPAFVVYKLVTLLFGAKAVEVPLVNYRHDLPALARAISSPSGRKKSASTWMIDLVLATTRPSRRSGSALPTRMKSIFRLLVRKAASAGAGVANWVSLFGQSDTRANRSIWFTGSPWQKDAPIALYWNASPSRTSRTSRRRRSFSPARTTSACARPVSTPSTSCPRPCHLPLRPAPPGAKCSPSP